MEIIILSAIALIVFYISIKCFQIQSLPKDSYLVVRDNCNKARIYKTKESIVGYQAFCLVNNIDCRVYKITSGSIDYIGHISSCKL